MNYGDLFPPMFAATHFAEAAERVAKDVSLRGTNSRQSKIDLSPFCASLAAEMAYISEQNYELNDWYKSIHLPQFPEELRCFCEPIDDLEFANRQQQKYDLDEEFRRYVDRCFEHCKCPYPRRLSEPDSEGGSTEIYSTLAEKQLAHDIMYYAARKKRQNVKVRGGPPVLVLAALCELLEAWWVRTLKTADATPKFHPKFRNRSSLTGDPYLANNPPARFLIACIRSIVSGASEANVASAWDNVKKERSRHRLRKKREDFDKHPT